MPVRYSAQTSEGAVTPQDYKAGQNESAFRDINEHLQGLNPERAGASSPYVCECWKAGCTEIIHLTGAEYEHVRSDSRWFVVRPEHVSIDVERVMERHSGYWIVEKFGASAKIANITDARREPPAP